MSVKEDTDPTVVTRPAKGPDDEQGALDALMSRLLGRSWRTTVLGALTLACAVVGVIPGIPGVVVDVAKVVMPFLAGGGLLAAKDKSVSGPPPR